MEAQQRAATHRAARQQLSPNQKKRKFSKSRGHISEGVTLRCGPVLDVSDGLTVIEPNLNDVESMEILKVLDNFMNDRQRHETRLIAWSTVGGPTHIPGVRCIQGGRFEIFVEAGTDVARKRNDAFCALIEELLQELAMAVAVVVAPQTDQANQPWADKGVDYVKRVLIGYASEQARRDPRIKQFDYEFDNFSLLINYSAVEVQYPHIDLLHPNVQCGCILTDKSAGTIAYTVPAPITSAEDLKKHIWTCMPDTLEKALQSNPHTVQLLKQFGSTLHSKCEEQPPPGRRTGTLYPRGTVFTLPGSRIHAGPKTNKHRCIMFFSGSLRGSQVASYNPDVQYYAPLLVADMLAIVFNSISVADRRYLIQRLDFLAKRCKTLHRHLNDEAMSEML